MDGFKRVVITSSKAAFLSASILWVMLAAEEDILDGVIIILIPISILILLIISFFAILITLLPFLENESEGLSCYKIFKKYFPFYSMLIFSALTFNIFYNDFDYYSIIFSTTTFLTAMQSWVWFFKTKKTNDI